MNQILVMEYLDMWSDLVMHSSSDISRLGYPKKSAGFSANGMSSFDDMDDGVNSHIAHTMDAIVTGLPADMRHAVEFYYGLNTTVRYEILPMIEMVDKEFILCDRVLRRVWDGMVDKELV